MKSISAGMSTHLNQTVTTLTSLWELTRTDGVKFFFTDHDKDVEFGGDTYVAANGYKRTAISNSVGLSVDNLDIEGVLDGIDEDELRVGLFDYAEIKVKLINYKNTADGIIKLRRGILGEVAFTSQGFYTAELRGLAQPLSQNIVEMYTVECRADLGDAQCKIPIFPDVILRNTAVVLGDFYRVATKTGTGIDWLDLGNNMSFDKDATGLDEALVTDWTVTSGLWNIFASDNGLTPDDGANFISGGTSASGAMEQTVDITDLGVDLVAVDAGNVTADFSVRRANQTAVADTGRVIVQARDAAGLLLSTLLDTTAEAISPEDTWVTRSFTGTTLPANTRQIRISLSYTNVSGGEADTAFDNLNLTLHDTVGVTTLQDLYENRVYEVTTAGTTAGSQPVYDTTIGNTTTDGTAVLTARDAFMRDGYIKDVIDIKNLIVIASDARDVDGWFDQGAIVFESGRNAGKVHEIRSWTQADTQANHFLPTPFEVLPGTKVRIYPGCDKRLATCSTKFLNAVNMRAEPFIPGQDEYLKFADAR